MSWVNNSLLFSPPPLPCTADLNPLLNTNGQHSDDRMSLFFFLSLFEEKKNKDTIGLSRILVEEKISQWQSPPSVRLGLLFPRQSNQRTARLLSQWWTFSSSFLLVDQSKKEERRDGKESKHLPIASRDSSTSITSIHASSLAAGPQSDQSKFNQLENREFSPSSLWPMSPKDVSSSYYWFLFSSILQAGLCLCCDDVTLRWNEVNDVIAAGQKENATRRDTTKSGNDVDAIFPLGQADKDRKKEEYY